MRAESMIEPAEQLRSYRKNGEISGLAFGVAAYLIERDEPVSPREIIEDLEIEKSKLSRAFVELERLNLLVKTGHTKSVMVSIEKVVRQSRDNQTAKSEVVSLHLAKQPETIVRQSRDNESTKPPVLLENTSDSEPLSPESGTYPVPPLNNSPSSGVLDLSPSPLLSSKTQKEESGSPTASPKIESKPSPVEEVFGEWRDVFRNRRPGGVKLDPKRRRFIQAAIKSHGVRVCKEAIWGCRLTAHNMGQNERKTPFNELTLILRDAEHVERFSITFRDWAEKNGWHLDAEGYGLDFKTKERREYIPAIEILKYPGEK